MHLPSRFFAISLLFFLITSSPLYGQLSGSYTIGGTTPDYFTIGAATSDVSTLGVSGPVVFNIRPGTYVDQFNLNNIAGASATNTIVFQSETGVASDVLVQYDTDSPTSGVVIFNGADFVSFKDMTLETTSDGTFSARVVRVQNGSENCSVEDCIVIGIGFGWTLSDRAVVYSVGGTNTNFSLIDNEISGGSFGVYHTDPITGLRIEGNQFIDQYQAGILLHGQIDPIVKENTVTSHVNNGNYSGILLESCDENVVVEKNRISIQNEGKYGIRLSHCDGTVAKPVLVANNFVHLGGIGSGLDTYGIESDYSNHHFYYNNSVHVKRSSGFTQGCLVLNGTGSEIYFQNNNLVNMGGGYAIFIGGTGLVLSDHNNLYSPMGWVGRLGASNRETLADWQSYTSQDPNSVSIGDVYLTDSDLHIRNYLLDNLGTPVAGVFDDIDEDLRDSFTPDIGADEFTTPANDAGLTSIDRALTLCTNSNELFLSLKNYGTSNLSSVTINWTVNGVLQTPFSWTGSLPQGDTIGPFSVGTYPFTLGVPYTIEAWPTDPNGGTEEWVYNDTIKMMDTYQALEGTYTIGGTTPDYATFADALVDLEAGGVCGPVVFNVRDGIYTEQIDIDYIWNTNAVNTVTFQPETGVAGGILITEFPAMTENYIIRLTDADWVTFQKMHIKANGLTYARAISFNGFATNNTFDECDIEGSPSTLTNPEHATIYFSGVANDSNTVSNSFIFRGSFNVYAEGLSYGNAFLNNLAQDAYAEPFHLERQAEIILDNNTLVSNSAYADFIPLYMKDCNRLNRVTKNRMSVTNQGEYGFYLENVNGSSARGLISNNFVSVEGTGGSAVYGIYAKNTGHIDFNNNSVNVNRALSSSYGFRQVGTSAGANRLKNNIIRVAPFGWGIYVEHTGAIDSSDYNNITGGNYFGYWSGNKSALGNWQIIPGLDANSLSVDPLFVSDSDLHTCNPALDGAGTPLANVPDDNDGEPRNLITPDIGADEFDLDFAADLGPDTTGCGAIELDAAATGSTYLWSTGDTTKLVIVDSTGLYEVSVENACGISSDTVNVVILSAPTVDLGSDTSICTGESLTLDAGNPGATYTWSSGGSTQTEPVIGSGTYAVTVNNGSCNDADSVLVTVFAAPIAGVSAGGFLTFCEGGSVLLTSDSTTGNQWLKDGTLLSGEVGNTYSATATGEYAVVVGSGSCADTSASILVNVIPAPGISAGPDVIACDGTPTPLNATGGVTYSWTPATGLSDTTIANPLASLRWPQPTL